MINRLSLLSIALSMLAMSCSFPGILSDDNVDESLSLPAFAPDGELFYNFTISGGPEGFNQNLAISRDGHVVYTDHSNPAQRLENKWDEAAIGAIDRLMLDNHFFDLEAAYVQDNAAVFFQYSLTYSSGGATKTVITDNIVVPEALQDLVSGSAHLIERLKSEVPAVALTLDKTEMMAGEELEMLLEISNLSQTPMTLNFANGQIFDFRVRSATIDAEIGQRDAEGTVWNWASDRAFSQAFWEMTLRAGQAESYLLSWDGADNMGIQLVGEFEISAALTSRPGGKSTSNLIKITQ